MNLADKYINLLFREIQDNRLPLKNYLSIITWAEDNNINTNDFEENWNSDAVKSSMREATLLMKTFEIRGVPQIIVDGEFLTSPAMAGSNKRLITLLDYLISLRTR
jgi:thiol:disulfide interchange protein DsbA